MNRSKIEYCDHTLNIITGCRYKCEYCYARQMSRRFSGNVKMRKMTDEQLVHYVEDRVAKADSEGFNRGKASARKGTGVKEFIDYIKSAKIPGVGAVTISKLIKVADENGYI